MYGRDCEGTRYRQDYNYTTKFRSIHIFLSKSPNLLAVLLLYKHLWEHKKLPFMVTYTYIKSIYWFRDFIYTPNVRGLLLVSPTQVTKPWKAIRRVYKRPKHPNSGWLDNPITGSVYTYFLTSPGHTSHHRECGVSTTVGHVSHGSRRARVSELRRKGR